MTEICIINAADTMTSFAVERIVQEAVEFMRFLDRHGDRTDEDGYVIIFSVAFNDAFALLGGPKPYFGDAEIIAQFEVAK